jgi:hypothetical protein
LNCGLSQFHLTPCGLESKGIGSPFSVSWLYIPVGNPKKWGKLRDFFGFIEGTPEVAIMLISLQNLKLFFVDYSYGKV